MKFLIVALAALALASATEDAARVKRSWGKLGNLAGLGYAAGYDSYAADCDDNGYPLQQQQIYYSAPLQQQQIYTPPRSVVVEKVVEKPVYVDRPVYVDKPVYVEKKVYVDKPVYIEKPAPVQQVQTYSYTTPIQTTQYQYQQPSYQQYQQPSYQYQQPSYQYQSQPLVYNRQSTGSWC